MRNKVFVLLLAFVAVFSCTTQKEILYFQDIDDITLKRLTNEYEAIIKKDDLLTIIISGPDKTVVQPFNLTLGENLTGGSMDPERSTLAYLVDPKGMMNFPQLGMIKVEGMTRNELRDYLTKEISKYVKSPIVYVAFKNYKVTVLGEVRNPGTYVMDSEKITILQALGKAGDLLITAERDGIILIRELDGQQFHIKINLTSADLLQSPYYYLQQNDVIYVRPSASRITQGTTATGVWSVILSSITTIVAMVSLIFSTIK